MKQGILFLLLIFMLNGCVHRGYSTDLTQTTTERYTKPSHNSQVDIKEVSSTPIVQKDSFYNFSDETKNNISGALILIIGLILIL